MAKGGPIKGWRKVTPLKYENRYVKGLILLISQKKFYEASGHLYKGWGILLLHPNGVKTYLNPALGALASMGSLGYHWTEMTKEDATERAFAYMRSHKAGW